MESDPIIAGVPASEWPDDELLALPWTFFMCFNEAEKLVLVERMKLAKERLSRSRSGPHAS